jgi:hypothetical protein
MDKAISAGIKLMGYRGILNLPKNDSDPIEVNEEHRDLVVFYARSLAHLGKEVQPPKGG